jgi:FkbM family methyltransferase
MPALSDPLKHLRSMTSNPPRKLAFILAATDHGTMVVNRFDYHMVDQNRGFGVGLDILDTAAFDRDGVDFASGLLALRRRYHGDGVVAIDCGANIGVFTLEWAREMTGWGSVIAIEAQERIYYALAGNIAINNCFNARAVLAAVSDKPGSMKVPKLDYGRPASFGSVEIKQRERTEFIGQPLDYADPSTNEVVCVTLDSFNLPRVDLVKIDVEGMEFDVLAGAGNLLRRCNPVLIIEFIKTDKNRLRAALEANDYGVFEFGMNFVAVHKSDKTIDHVRVNV